MADDWYEIQWALKNRQKIVSADVVDFISGDGSISLNNCKIFEYIIEGETVNVASVQNVGKPYTIWEIRAPGAVPEEATMTLMLPSGGTTPAYFVDFSMMNYGGYPRFNIVVQTRGGTLQPLNIVFNNGIISPCTFRFSPDGTTGVFKDVPEDNRKFTLGSFGRLQDVLKGANASDPVNNISCFLFNCYVSDQATMTYTRINENVTCRKTQMDNDGFIVYETGAGVGTFTETDWVDLLRISYNTFRYRGNNVAVKKTKAGAFIASELGVNDIGIDTVNNRMYVNVGGVAKYVALT